MDRDIFAGLSAWLKGRQEELLADLAGLVAIPTVVRENEGGYPYGSALARAVAYIGGLADKYGFSWHKYAGTGLQPSLRHSIGKNPLGHGSGAERRGINAAGCHFAGKLTGTKETRLHGG